VEQGLSQSSGYAMLQDARGFVWIGTADGLNKYDGTSFTVYRHISFDTTSISDNFVQVLLEDRSKRYLWVGTRDGGLNRFDRIRGTFSVFQHNPRRHSTLSANHITALVQDSTGVLWIGTDGGGLNRLDPRTGTVTRFQHDERRASSLRSNTVLALCLDSAGKLWVGTDMGLDAVHTTRIQEGAFQHHEVEPRLESHSESRPEPHRTHVYTLTYTAQSRTLWAGTDAGLYHLNLSGTASLLAFRPVEELESDVVRCLYADHPGCVWACTAVGGVFCIAQGKDAVVKDPSLSLMKREVLPTKERSSPAVITAYHRMNAELQAASGSGIYSMMQDNAGLVWIGTYSGGVVTFLARAAAFRTIASDPTNPASTSHLNRFAVTALYDDAPKNTLWVGTLDGGLNRFDRERGVFTLFRRNEEDAQSLPSDGVRAIYRDRAGVLWLATQDGLAMMNPDGRTFTTFRHDAANPRSISSSNVFCIFEDRRGTLWVGTLGGGLNRFDRTTRTFTVFKHDPANPRSISGNVIRAICEDSTGGLWVGTRGAGLNRFDTRTQEFASFLHDEANPRSLSHNSIYSLYLDKRGLLWIGTQGGGVNVAAVQHVAHTALVFAVFRATDGLPNDVVYGIVEDRQGNIWLSTNKGISRIHGEWLPKADNNKIARLSFRNYDERDGLQSNEFNAGAYCAGRDGTLYFGGIRGFTAFQPDSVLDNPFVPPIVITDFKLFNKSVKPAGKEISESEAIEISYRDNYFLLEFAALSFIVPEKNRYRYMLEGFDKTWIEAGTKHEVAYTNLDEGEYVFRVQGSNNDGVWNTQGASLRVRITPPWWRTLWFRMLAGLATLGVATGFMLWRIRAVRVAERMSRQMAQLELQSLRLHMNPHFIFNAINSIQYLVSEGQAQAATHYLSTFARLMRKILKQHDYLSISIADELELLEMYIDLERLRYDYTFDYELHCEHRAELAPILIPAMVVQPFVENAIRHGLGTRKHGGKLRVQFARRNGHIYCVVEDNGIGRAQAQALQRKRLSDVGEKQNLSIATNITQRRLEILDAAHTSRNASANVETHISVQTTDLKDKDGSAAGTRVEIILPIVR
jgi:ligand-binding sensor domain-containing protein